MNPFAFLSDCYHALGKSFAAAKAERIERGIAAERVKVAKAFNDLYTYRFRFDTSSSDRLDGVGMYGYSPEKGYAWMCPKCNKIHYAESISAFSGLQYPNCCDHRMGHRLYDEIRTK